ncbi:hypothetical protein H1P_6000002 [Hyella patelloides LEGE 07179]|uniref:Uncharacterized protein n=1 Tax=Hyella patelloides LEGE 07179 TaxID=945734 RepID=A0A563W1C8_9CYAN|nr:hypothetical protein H1P_6000002 [Hyella patelloides LEGE 07179]
MLQGIEIKNINHLGIIAGIIDSRIKFKINSTQTKISCN